MSRPTSTMRTRKVAHQIGDHLRTQRKLLGITAEQLAQRANISRGTLRRLEEGEVTVGLGVFLEVSRLLGMGDRVLDAVDPYQTDLGRILADQKLPERVRPRS